MQNVIPSPDGSGFEFDTHKPAPATLCNWKEISLFKRYLLSVLFMIAFLILDGSSTTAQRWEGAPPWYLPVGLSLALLLCAGAWSIPLVFLSSVIAAYVNYHCPLLSWSGIPGAVGVYVGYVAAAIVLTRWWRTDLVRATLSDVVRYLLAALGGSLVSTIVGVSAVLGDGKIQRSQFLRTAAEWWVSDALAFVVFTPFLIICVAPIVAKWLNPAGRGPARSRSARSYGASQVMEVSAQSLLAVIVIWLVFGCKPLIPYQPLYLLFIPVIWVSVRRGLWGATFASFAIGAGMTVAAWLTQAPRGSLPKLQLATLALGLTALFLGAVVSERRRGEQAVRDSETRYRLLFERNLAGVFRTTLDGRVLECNPAAAQLFGYDSAEELLQVSVVSLYQNAADREAFLGKLKSETHITNHEMKFRRKNGEVVWVMLNVTLVGSDAGTEPIVEGTLVNITPRKDAEEHVRELAYYDSLTGLPNRTLMLDRFSQALAAAKRRKHKVGLLFLDLDRFKTINDSLGHSVGDLLLQEVAARLKACIREQDTVARLGGDEFLIVLGDVKDVPDIAVAAERCMDAMFGRFDIRGHALSVGCSIGISIFPDHGTDTETLIKHADSAMYTAKEKGRNTFMFFTAEMNREALERLELENALRGALEKHELFLVYQPQMDIPSGTILGLEALLRWNHPELGLVPPDRFIRIAETSGLILQIGEWVLKTACQQAKRWQDQGLVVPIAVNVSAVQFRHESFCAKLRATLLESGLPAQFLELELTESLLLANADCTLSTIQELKNMGVKLVIDDFGTGYSSLSYLRRLPVTKLKIDRSFIRDLGVNQEDAAITTAVISMAKSLNLTVIAEGVETERQMSFLRARHCGGIQGYFFSKPLSVEEVRRRFVPEASAMASVARSMEGRPADMDDTGILL
ncbi:MAG TPA: EAL domain-containing protein [Candidatus Aquilonibacter sp.]|nr:EAL domain-containing protein [Candidatus Aquilonibacter sp.]